jgi:predicted ribosome quality control (RQC) complex YloA/Tae2 family protein
MKIPFDSLVLRATTDELQSTLVGGSIQRVSQPEPHELVLGIRHRGATHRLVLSCDATFARVHLTALKHSNPASPPAFCMMCRKHLEGARVERIEQRDFDRILEITARSAERSFILIVELMGKHSNLILCTEEGMVLDAAKRITRNVSRYREVLPGVPYLPPPPQEGKRNPFEVMSNELELFEVASDIEALSARLMGSFCGLSPFLADEIANRASQSSIAEAWTEIFGAAQIGKWLPVLIRNEHSEPIGAYPFPTVQVPADRQHERGCLNAALDNYYSVAIPRAGLDSARHELITAIDRAIKSKTTKLASLERSLHEAGRAESYKQAGELLLANLNGVEPGADSICVPDLFLDGLGERIIELDPKMSVRENADAYFRRYRKARDGVKIQSEQREHTASDLSLLRVARHDVDNAIDLKGLQSMRFDLRSAGLLHRESAPDEKAKKGPTFQGKKVRTYHTPEGWEIYLGENAEANDYLTGRIAAPNDLWLHVRSATSAHVVIRTRNNPQSVPKSVIRRAAVLAAKHSSSKHASIVPVDYTLKKYVRRPRGAAPGMVTYMNEKTIHVNPGHDEQHSLD